MPAKAESLRITDAFRARERALRNYAERAAAQRWAGVGLANLDQTHAAWIDTTAATLLEVQRTGARLTAGYLAAYLTSELGHRVVPPTPADTGIGLTASGTTVTEALKPTVIAVKVALSAGLRPEDALAAGLHRATRVVGEAAVHPVLSSLHSGIATDDRFIGWQRVCQAGACLACLALAGQEMERRAAIQRHPHCDCTAEPRVGGVPENYKRPTGRDYFDRFSAEDQDKLYGADKAELIRTGEATLDDFVEVSPQRWEPDHVTEASITTLRQAQAA